MNNYLWKLRLLDLSPLEVTWGRSIFTSLYALGLVAFSGFDGLLAAWNADGALYLAAVTAGGLGLLGLVRGVRLAGLVQFSAYYVLITIFSGVIVADWTLSSWLGAGLVLLAFSLHVGTHKGDKFSLQANSWLALMVIGFTLSAFLSWTLVRRHPVGVLVASQEWFILGAASIGVLLRQGQAVGVFRSARSNWHSHASFGAVIFLAMYAADLGLRITDPFLHNASGLLVPLLTAGFGAISLRESVHRSFPLTVVLMLAGLWVMAGGG